MYSRNPDTGKWMNQNDLLLRDSYDSLKIDLNKTKLYSKCLSGSTYLTIKDFDDLYPTLNIDKGGYYVGDNANSSVNSSIKVDSSNMVEFYDKYLKEDAFTVKNSFTFDRTIIDQGINTKYVDLATTEYLAIQPSKNLIIDGTSALSGHRILVKDNTASITLKSSQNPDDYFTKNFPVSYYEILHKDSDSTTYLYYDKSNGIYLYDGYNLNREVDLDSYESSFKYICFCKMGEINSDKEFHLQRLKNGYFPIVNDPIYFKEQKGWVMRNRVDYSNLFDLNYYDAINQQSQDVYDPIIGKTYSIPPRVLSVGGFGVIMISQDKLSPSATHSVSSIVPNKYKETLRSVDGVKNYYWVCGNKGTLLRISKIDLSISKIDLGEELNLTSISFYNDLYGALVGDFNTIYFTRDGGIKWSKIEYSDLDGFSYNKVIHSDENTIYVGGQSGVFVEFTFVSPNFVAYSRSIVKHLSKIDEYDMVEDINYIYKTTWNRINPFTFSTPVSPFEDGNQITYNFYLNDNYKFLSYSIIKPSNGVYIDISVSVSVTDPDGFSYPNAFSPGSFSLPLDDMGNPKSGNYILDIEVTATNTSTYTTTTTTFYERFSSVSGDILLIGANNQTVIAYDPNRIISNIDNDFVYITFPSNVKDVKTIVRKPNSQQIYIGADKIYSFNLSSFYNFENVGTNLSSVKDGFDQIQDLYANKLLSSTSSLFIVGNNSLLSLYSYDTSTISEIDPTFLSKLNSRFLIMDYDIGSKLNFFDSNLSYRLPISKTFSSTLFSHTFSVYSIDGQKSWIDFQKDSLKTFKYYTSMEDSNVVEFSTNFSYTDQSYLSFTLSGSQIGNKIDNFYLPDYTSTIAPSFSLGDTHSEFISNSAYGFSPKFGTTYSALFHKNISIFKRSYTYPYHIDIFNIGDVLRINSDVVDDNLTICRSEIYLQYNSDGPGIYPSRTQSIPTYFDGIKQVDVYLYTYNNFNESILNSLIDSKSNIDITNLNRYSSVDSLISNFNNHPIGQGYRLSSSNDVVYLDPLFNNKTAYYNLQLKSTINGNENDLVYEKSFLDFGYSPTYNIESYLSKINPITFTSSKVFSILPIHMNITGNNGNSLTQSVVYIDSSSINKNTLLFGKNLEFIWRSLLINTFIDIGAQGTNTYFNIDQILVQKKYYNPDQDYYVIEFNKNLPINENIIYFDFKSRNTLSLISQDLQTLNNIQRLAVTKSVQNSRTFTNYGNLTSTKISTESYLKTFVSDYDIRKNVSSIIYIDHDMELSMNVLNIDKKLVYNCSSIIDNTVNGQHKFGFNVEGPPIDFKIGDVIYVELVGTQSSTMNGIQTIIDVNGNLITTSRNYDNPFLVNKASLTAFKKDDFFNYIPIDIFKQVVSSQITNSIEVLAQNYTSVGSTFSLTGVNLNKHRLKLVDGLFLSDLNRYAHWILEADISNALLGKDENGIVWYSGIWKCGRWFGGTWISGDWYGGDWYGGKWSSFSIREKTSDSIKVDSSTIDPLTSRWFDGRWFDGYWMGGSWYGGRRYAGEWQNGIWYNGIWNDGTWNSGIFSGGIWVNGTWKTGIFNCDSKPSYWIDGTFQSGDFENGVWYNGNFGNTQKIPSRFGTRSSNSRTSNWESGVWLDGEFHSKINYDSLISDTPIVSDIHKYSIWKTGVWNSGNWYGGICYNIDFRSGTWHGGILDQIQVIGIDALSSFTNKIYVNGSFLFNPGDYIWIIDNDSQSPFSDIGSNSNPKKYRILFSSVESTEPYVTGLHLNYNLSTLNIKEPYYSTTYSNVDIGLRVVSNFDHSDWNSGVWRNGIFNKGNFYGGIWYDGIFNGNWGT